MTTLVTGGVGYIGSRVIRELPNHPAYADQRIRILDNFRQPRYHALWDLPAAVEYDVVRGDIRDAPTRERALEDVETVIHLAAITNAGETFDMPDETWAVNHRAAVDLYEEARAAGVDRFVNAVTCSVYGRTDEEITETAECTPESPYAEAKLAAEREMRERHDGTMELTGLRLGTVYGWTRGMRFDTVVDKFALLAALGEPLTVYEGAEDQRRPYLHVRDAVRSLLFAGAELGDGGVYNVVGENAALREVVATIERHFPDVEVGYTDAENINQLSYVVSDGKIREAGFAPEGTLDEGVAELAAKFDGLR